MAARNPWLVHLSAFWKTVKGKMSYRQAMVAAKKTYQRKAEPQKKKRRRRKKASSAT